jgi:hypothetical protein
MVVSTGGSVVVEARRPIPEASRAQGLPRKRREVVRIVRCLLKHKPSMSAPCRELEHEGQADGQ